MEAFLSYNAILDNGGTIQIVDGDFFTINKLSAWNGTITQTGGTLYTESFGDPAVNPAFSIGGSAGQTATYNVSGGAAIVGGLVRIGEAGGMGVMSLSNTSSYASTAGWDSWIGDGGGTGTLTLSDSATWTITGNALVVGRNLRYRHTSPDRGSRAGNDLPRGGWPRSCLRSACAAGPRKASRY